MTRLLSTKILSKGFKEKLLMNSIRLVEQPFIKIKSIKKLEFPKAYQSIIFSSQNSVKIALANPKIKLLFDKTNLLYWKKDSIPFNQKWAKSCQNS